MVSWGVLGLYTLLAHSHVPQCMHMSAATGQINNLATLNGKNKVEGGAKGVLNIFS